MGKVVDFTPDKKKTLKDDLADVVSHLDDDDHTSWLLMTWRDRDGTETADAKVYWQNNTSIPGECLPEYLKQKLRRATEQ